MCDVCSLTVERVLIAFTSSLRAAVFAAQLCVISIRPSKKKNVIRRYLGFDSVSNFFEIVF